MDSSFTRFINEPICVYPWNFKSDPEYSALKAAKDSGKGKLSLEDHLKLAFMTDDEDEFVNVAKDLSPDQDLPPHFFFPMYAYDAVNCASQLRHNSDFDWEFNFWDTAIGKIKYRHPYNFTVSTPLHEAALSEAVNIIRLILNLNCMKEWSEKKSIFKLIAILCRPEMARRIETVRLLASKTGDIDQEFFKYIKDGKLAEMSVLLLAGCRPPPCSSLLHCRDDLPEKEKILELFEVFNTIGGKLSDYIRTKRSKFVKVEQVTSEIASLFEDSGFRLKREDISSMYEESPWDYPVPPTCGSKKISVPSLVSSRPPPLGGLSFTNKGSTPMNGVRQFHNASVPKAIPCVQVKNQVITRDVNYQLFKHRACSYFTGALRRVGRLL